MRIGASRHYALESEDSGLGLTTVRSVQSVPVTFDAILLHQSRRQWTIPRNPLARNKAAQHSGVRIAIFKGRCFRALLSRSLFLGCALAFHSAQHDITRSR